jgi:hypothetical protein
LHLGEPMPPAAAPANGVAVTRWIAAPRSGTLVRVEIPDDRDPRVRSVELFAREGDHVRPPAQNSDRLACVMACAASRAEAEVSAEAVVAGSRVVLED